MQHPLQREIQDAVASLCHGAAFAAEQHVATLVDAVIAMVMREVRSHLSRVADLETELNSEHERRINLEELLLNRHDDLRYLQEQVSRQQRALDYINTFVSRWASGEVSAEAAVAWVKATLDAASTDEGR